MVRAGEAHRLVLRADAHPQESLERHLSTDSFSGDSKLMRKWARGARRTRDVGTRGEAHPGRGHAGRGAPGTWARGAGRTRDVGMG